jgi:predicted DsbA family dithiol-disulfide isomerase
MLRESVVAKTTVTYFTDILCVWAYVSQVRVDALNTTFGDTLRLEHRFCSVFGDSVKKINGAWKDKGAYEGFNLHLRHVAKKFPHVKLHPDIWLAVRPLSSASPQLFLKAVQRWANTLVASKDECGLAIFDRVMWAFRCAFFQDCRDISRWSIQCEVAESAGVNVDAVLELIHCGKAFADLSSDYQDADKMRIEGSPSLVLNEGRQKLYGNVGFRVMQANIQELIRTPHRDEASWC